jgi:hypothetical protein
LIVHAFLQSIPCGFFLSSCGKVLLELSKYASKVNEEKFDKHTHEKVLVMLLILNGKNSQGIKRNCDRMQNRSKYLNTIISWDVHVGSMVHVSVLIVKSCD